MEQRPAANDGRNLRESAGLDALTLLWSRRRCEHLISSRSHPEARTHRSAYATHFSRDHWRWTSADFSTTWCEYDRCNYIRADEVREQAESFEFLHSHVG